MTLRQVFEPQQTGHGPLFPHPRIGTRSFIRSLEQIRGISKGSCSDEICGFMSFEKACSSAVVVHALTSILAAKELAHFSARWDEWILLTAREQEGVFLFWRRTVSGPKFLGLLRPAISFYLGSPFLQMVSWSVAQQVPSRVASTRSWRFYYRSGNISDLANRESLGDKSLKNIRPLQPFELLARDQETENTRRNVSHRRSNVFKCIWICLKQFEFLVSHIVTAETSIKRDNHVLEKNQRGTSKETIAFENSSFTLHLLPPRLGVSKQLWQQQTGSTHWWWI